MRKARITVWAAILMAFFLIVFYALNQVFAKNIIYPNGNTQGPMNVVTSGNKSVACPSPLTPILINGDLFEECFNQEQIKQKISKVFGNL